MYIVAVIKNEQMNGWIYESGKKRKVFEAKHNLDIESRGHNKWNGAHDRHETELGSR